MAAVALWRAAALVARMREGLAARAAEPGAGMATDQRFLRLLAQALRAVAVIAPVAAAAGYLPAAEMMVFPTIMTLGLIGAGIVAFDLLNAAALSLLRRPSAAGEQAEGGLIPVAIAAFLILAAVPVLALIWGARPSDLADGWAMLRDGVTYGGIRLSAGVVLTLVVVTAVGIALTRLVQGVLRAYVVPRTRLDAGGRNALVSGVGYLGFFFAGLAAIAAAGLDLSNLALVAGALSVGIGFGLQNVVSNFVSGIILLIERPVKEGDWIEVGGNSGYVRGISVRSTEIETFDRASVIVPNSDLIAGVVLNRTHGDLTGRLIVPVGVAYDSDVRLVERILLDIAEGHPLVLEAPAPAVLLIGFGADALNFEIRCRLRDVNYSLTVHSDMNFEIVERFRAEGIAIPFPQRDVRVAGIERLIAAAEREPGAVAVALGEDATKEP
jgi:potassium-dependent mechanosensitive channel